MGAKFFAVFLALGVITVLLTAVLFDLTALHDKVDAMASAAPSPVLLEEYGSEWDFGTPELVSPAPPLFPPLIIEKTVVVETPAKEILVEKAPSAPVRPWWCGLASDVGFDPEACREAVAPGISPAEPEAPALAPENRPETSG